MHIASQDYTKKDSEPKIQLQILQEEITISVNR